MTTCNHSHHSRCEFCDLKGRMNVAVDGNGDPKALRPEADNPSRRGMLRGTVATGVGALVSAGWVGNSMARGEGGKLGVRNHYYVPATDKTVHWGYFSKSLKPQVEVESGDFVTLETLTHHAGDDFERIIKGDPGAESVFFWDKSRKGVNRRGAGSMNGKLGAGDGQGVHISTGPVLIKGAEEGDVPRSANHRRDTAPFGESHSPGQELRQQRCSVVGLPLQRTDHGAEEARGHHDLPDRRTRRQELGAGGSTTSSGRRRPTRTESCTRRSTTRASS